MNHKELVPDVQNGEQDPDDYDLPVIPKELEHRTAYFRSLPSFMQEEIIALEMEALEGKEEADKCHVKYSNLPAGLKESTLWHISEQPEGTTAELFVARSENPYVLLDLLDNMNVDRDLVFDLRQEWLIGISPTAINKYDMCDKIRATFGSQIVNILTTPL